VAEQVVLAVALAVALGVYLVVEDLVEQAPIAELVATRVAVAGQLQETLVAQVCLALVGFTVLRLLFNLNLD
jgi:hypothetical protein